MMEDMAKKSCIKRPVLKEWTKNRCLREGKKGTEGVFEGERDKCKEEESKQNEMSGFPSYHCPR